MTKRALKQPDLQCSATDADLFLWKQLEADSASMLEASLATDAQLDAQSVFKTIFKRYAALAKERRLSSVYEDLEGLKDKLDTSAERSSAHVWKLLLSELQKTEDKGPSEQLTILVESYSMLKDQGRTDLEAMRVYMTKLDLDELERLASGGAARRRSSATKRADKLSS